MKCMSIVACMAFAYALLGWPGVSLSVEEPPDSLAAASPSTFAYHTYSGFDIAKYYPSFDNVFMLLVTDGVEAAWDSAGVAQFVERVMDDDSTNTDDVFPAVWNYFCYGDSDASYAGVRYTLDTVRNRTRIILWLYDKADFTCPSSSRECKGWSWQIADNLILNVVGNRLKSPQDSPGSKV